MHSTRTPHGVGSTDARLPGGRGDATMVERPQAGSSSDPSIAPSGAAGILSPIVMRTGVRPVSNAPCGARDED